MDYLLRCNGIWWNSSLLRLHLVFMKLCELDLLFHRPLSHMLLCAIRRFMYRECKCMYSDRISNFLISSNNYKILCTYHSQKTQMYKRIILFTLSDLIESHIQYASHFLLAFKLGACYLYTEFNWWYWYRTRQYLHNTVQNIPIPIIVYTHYMLMHQITILLTDWVIFSWYWTFDSFSLLFVPGFVRILYQLFSVIGIDLQWEFLCKCLENHLTENIFANKYLSYFFWVFRNNNWC